MSADPLQPTPEGVVVMDAHTMAAQVAENDAAVFVSARAYGYYDLPDRGEVPAVEIDVPWIEELVAEGGVDCVHFGIATELEGVPIGTQLFFRLSIAPLYIAIDDAKPTFLDEAIDKGVAAVFPARPDGRRVYLATGPMHRFEQPTVVEPKTGRNSPCPCGSGRKFKRCHGG